MNIAKGFIFLSLILVVASNVTAQEKQKVPAEFFTGKWAGTISGYAYYHTHRDGRKDEERTVNFNIDWFSPSGGFGGELIINPWKTKGVGYLIFLGGFPVEENGKIYYVSPFAVDFAFEFSETELVPGTDQWILATWLMALIDFTKSNNRVDLKNNTIYINHKQEEECTECGGVSQAFVYSGELHRIQTKKDTLGKTVKVDEPIMTDKFTQREIIVPNVGEVVVNSNSECVFRSDKFLEQTLGELLYEIGYKRDENEKVKPLPDHDVDKILEQTLKDLHTVQNKFKVRMPQAVCGVRGTRFITKVEKDGTTTVTVLDGEVEFSDKQMKKTVVVKKNQMATVKPGGLPSEPVSIDPGQTLKWWE